MMKTTADDDDDDDDDDADDDEEEAVEGNLTTILLAHFVNTINGAMNIVTENGLNLECSTKNYKRCL
jgi:hypothetical protein